MIARTSRTKRPRLFPICRFIRCRSVATEMWSRYSREPFLCGMHFAYLNALPPDAK